MGSSAGKEITQSTSINQLNAINYNNNNNNNNSSSNLQLQINQLHGQSKPQMKADLVLKVCKIIPGPASSVLGMGMAAFIGLREKMLTNTIKNGEVVEALHSMFRVLSKLRNYVDSILTAYEQFEQFKYPEVLSFLDKTKVHLTSIATIIATCVNNEVGITKEPFNIRNIRIVTEQFEDSYSNVQVMVTTDIITLNVFLFNHLIPKEFSGRRINVSSAAIERIPNAVPKQLPSSLLSDWYGNEEQTTIRLRAQMVQQMRENSNFRNIISNVVETAIGKVPRHLFAHDDSRRNIADLYNYQKPMKATDWTSESSPEVVASMLSLIQLSPGSKVVMIGGKGGYIQSVVSQITGLTGEVITLSTLVNVLNTSSDRCSVSQLSQTMKWIPVNDWQNWDSILSTHFSTLINANAIIFCGAVNELPSTLFGILHSNGQMVAPVCSNRDDTQYYVVYSHSSKSLKRYLTPLRFGPIL